MMLKELLKLHRYYYTKNDLIYSKTRRYSFVWVLSNVMIRLLNFLLYVILRICGTRNYEYISKSKQPNLIVSFTSYPARIKTLWMVIDSILKQTISPEAIYLYLSEDEFPNRENDLPKQLLKQINYGLNIVFVKGNIRSHKKYFYSFRDFPTKSIITIDDDLYYHRDMIKDLLELSREFPNSICCNNASLIYGIDGKSGLYRKWNRIESRCGPSNYVLPIGFGGILYPEPFRFSKELFNVDNFIELAPTADDLWLKAMAILSDIDAVVGDYRSSPCEILGTASSALMNINTSKTEVSNNDIQWRNILNKYEYINSLIKLKL